VKRVVHKAKNFQEAQKWDIRQQVSLSPQERQQIAKTLKRKVYGPKPPEIGRVKIDQ